MAVGNVPTPHSNLHVGGRSQFREVIYSLCTPSQYQSLKCKWISSNKIGESRFLRMSLVVIPNTFPTVLTWLQLIGMEIQQIEDGAPCYPPLDQ